MPFVLLASQPSPCAVTRPIAAGLCLWPDDAHALLPAALNPDYSSWRGGSSELRDFQTRFTYVENMVFWARWSELVCSTALLKKTASAMNKPG